MNSRRNTVVRTSVTHPPRRPLFCSYHIITSYRVSITEQTTAKCYLFVKYTPGMALICHVSVFHVSVFHVSVFHVSVFHVSVFHVSVSVSVSVCQCFPDNRKRTYTSINRAYSVNMSCIPRLSSVFMFFDFYNILQIILASNRV